MNKLIEMTNAQSSKGSQQKEIERDSSFNIERRRVDVHFREFQIHKLHKSADYSIQLNN